jgi:hypothetical protein
MPCLIIQSNFSCSHAPAASVKITDNNSCSRHNHRAITSEGGQTNDAQSITSEGAHALTESLPRQLVPKRLLRHGHCPHGHRPRNNYWSKQHLANTVIHPVAGKEMEYMALMKDPRLQPLWKRGSGNECGRLFQGIRDIAGTDTCLFIKLTNLPKDRNITYGKIVCDYKPHKQ